YPPARASEPLAPGASHRTGGGQYLLVGDADRLDAATALQANRRRPGHGIEPLRGDVRGCHRYRDLLQHRPGHPLPVPDRLTDLSTKYKKDSKRDFLLSFLYFVLRTSYLSVCVFRIGMRKGRPVGRPLVLWDLLPRITQ